MLLEFDVGVIVQGNRRIGRRCLWKSKNTREGNEITLHRWYFWNNLTFDLLPAEYYRRIIPLCLYLFAPCYTHARARIYTHTHTCGRYLSSFDEERNGWREKERERERKGKKVWYKRWRATIRAGVSNDTRQKEQKEIQESRGGIVLSSRTRQLHWLSR